jgi:hypothetical protein
MSHGVLLGEKCPQCSQFRNPAEILRFGLDGCVRLCLKCYEHHLEVLKIMASGQPPKACQECNTEFSNLAADAAGNSRMYIHSKDGVYQVLCSRCSDAYELKRADLYRSTPYGAEKRI